MAGTAVHVSRDNSMSTKMAALGGVDFKMAGNGADAVTNITNDTSGDLTLVCYKSKDMAIDSCPKKISAKSPATIPGSKTTGSGCVYRGANPFGVGYDWVFAWASKPDLEEVYVTIHDTQDAYSEDDWNAIFEKVDSATSSCSSRYMGYSVQANIQNDTSCQAMVNAKIKK